MNRLEQAFKRWQTELAVAAICAAPFLLLRFYPDAGFGLAGLACALAFGVIQLVDDWRVGVTALAGLLALTVYSFVSDRTLIPSSTVYDFMKADVAERSAFKMNMCKNGNCLTYIDWKCGFSNGEDHKVEACFDMVVKRVEPWEKLDAIVKFCDQTLANFVDTQFSTSAECKKQGGVWGVKSVLRPLQERSH
jgi:hypothetical protein